MAASEALAVGLASMGRFSKRRASRPKIPPRRHKQRIRLDFSFAHRPSPAHPPDRRVGFSDGVPEFPTSTQLADL